MTGSRVIFEGVSLTLSTQITVESRVSRRVKRESGRVDRAAQQLV